MRLRAVAPPPGPSRAGPRSAPVRRAKPARRAPGPRGPRPPRGNRSRRRSRLRARAAPPAIARVAGTTRGRVAAARGAPGRAGRNGWSTRAATSNAPFPESRISAMADRPGGVASATMGSDNTFPPSLVPLPLGLLPLLPQAAPRDQVLLRDAEDVAYGIIEVQPRGEAEKQQR